MRETMDIIYEFCKDAEKVYASTTNVVSLKDFIIRINIKKDEVWRSVWNRNMDCIFTFDLSYGNSYNLVDQVRFMQTIELYYPKTFSWRYNGQHIEVVALIPLSKKENLGIFGRYKGVFGFIAKLREKITDILKYRDFTGVSIIKYIDMKILSTGSINAETNMYCIDISPTDTTGSIVLKSNKRKINDISLRELNMRYWVREINPDYYRDVRVRPDTKIPLTDDIWKKYPKAIQRIANLPKKGNYNRFLLATYFLGIHNERDAKHQLFSCLNDDERKHMTSGNCKDQWRAILAKGYGPPSIKTLIEYGFANNVEDCMTELVQNEHKTDD